VGESRTHLGRDVALESDEEEADAVEQVLVADVVIRAGRGHGREPKGVRVWVWGFFAPELVRAWLTGEDSRAGQEEGNQIGISIWRETKRVFFFGRLQPVKVFRSLGLAFVLFVLAGCRACAACRTYGPGWIGLFVISLYLCHIFVYCR
jgi:hypothetical protein